MIAVDTNILVRLVTRDDDVQAKRAAALKNAVGLPQVTVEDK